MGKGSGGESTNTSYTSSLPEYAEPYYHELMGKAEAVSQEPYIPYQGDRISQFSPDQTAAQGSTRDVYNYGNPSLDAAQQFASFGTANAMGSSYDPYAVGVNYNPYAYDPGAFSAMMLDPNGNRMQQPGDVNTGVFGSDVSDFYMSPYMDAVVERQKAGAELDFNRQGAARDSAAIAAGAYGGDRRFVGDYLAEEGMLDRMADIEATGRQSAFENAQMQYERDRQARLQADLSNQGMAFNTGAANLNASTQYGLANQNQWLEAQRMGEQSRQFGAGLFDQGSQFGADMDYQTQALNEANRLASANYGLETDRLGLTGAGMLGDLGGADQASWLQRIQALSG